MSSNPSELTRVVSEVIEDFCMMTVDPPGPEEAFEPQLEGTIDFTGPVCGRLVLRCPESLGQTVAANLLGTLEGDAASQTNAWDALAELLNIVCGNVTTCLFDAAKPFTLSIPQVNTLGRASGGHCSESTISSPADGHGPYQQETIRLLLDGQPTEITLIVTNGNTEGGGAAAREGVPATAGQS